MMVIMVALVISLMSVIFTIVIPLVKEKTEKAEACGINLLDKISINSEYVCYGGSEIRFNIEIGDIEVEDMLVSISSETTGGVFKILEDGEITLYPSGEFPEKLNSKSGKTYSVSIDFVPTLIQIAPVINGEQCDVVDSFSQIPLCSEIASFD